MLMDRVEGFIRAAIEGAEGLEARRMRQEYVRIGVLRILLLLFADDLVLCSHS